MFMTVMGMRYGLVLMLVLMFVFVMAAHFTSPPPRLFYYIIRVTNIKSSNRHIPILSYFDSPAYIKFTLGPIPYRP
jgi:hypothetical protein